VHRRPASPGPVEQARDPARGEPGRPDPGRGQRTAHHPRDLSGARAAGEAWAFALYDPATEGYTPAVLVTGSRIGSPTEAYDTAALVHLANYQK
jgi:hypothetical protein